MAVSLSDSPTSQGPICPVCFRDYSDSEAELIPRILQCGHTYCSECLERLMNIVPEEDNIQQLVFNIRYAGREWTSTRRFPWLGGASPPLPNDEIKCPTCSSVNHIRNRDVSTLTKNFALLSCRPQQSNPKPQKTQYFCKEHDHEKRVYCNDCKTLICAYCQLYGVHKEHKYTLATEAAKPLVDALKTAGKSLTDDFRDLSLGETEVNSAVMKLERNRRRCEQKVQQYYSKIIDKLELRKEFLVDEIGSWTEEQMYILNAQLESLTDAMKDSDKLRKRCASLAEGDPLNALSEHDSVMSDIKELHKRVEGLSFQPLINPWMKCKTTPERLRDAIGSVFENCQLSQDTDRVPETGEEGESDSDSENSSLHDGDDDGNDDEGPGGGVAEKRKGIPGFRLGLGSRRGGAACRSSDSEEDDDSGDIKKKPHVHSQESHALFPNFGDGGDQDPHPPKLDSFSSSHGLHPAVRPTYSFLEPNSGRAGASNFSGATPNNSYQSTPTSAHAQDTGASNSVLVKPKVWSSFLHGPRLSIPSDSTSNTDEDDDVGDDHHHITSSLPITALRMDRYRMTSRDGGGSSSEDSTHTAEEDTLEPAEAEQSHYTSASVLDSVELRHRYSSLGTAMAIGELSAPSYGGEDDASMLNHSYQSDLASPPQSDGDRSGDEDFTYGHHLSLPVDSGHNDDEIVFPVPRQFSWTTDQSDGRARAVMFEIDHNGTSVQFSIRAPGGTDRGEQDMDLTDSDNSTAF